jgi:hypothetical protein
MVVLTLVLLAGIRVEEFVEVAPSIGITKLTARDLNRHAISHLAISEDRVPLTYLPV